MPRRLRELTRLVAALALFAGLLLSTSQAGAYPWMIRHGYKQCATCHLDPTGAGPLTPYGRALGEIVLATPWGERGEETKANEFLWGAVEVPEQLLLGGHVRYARLTQKVEDAPLTKRNIWMQLDAEAGLMFQHFVASASIGFAPEGALGSAITRGPENNLISRTHWLGVMPIPEALLIRAGRMNLPFGIRNVEHTLWARTLTQTAINDDQQYGAAISIETPLVRGEIMGIAGNLQLRPGEFREQGYSAFVEWMPSDDVAIGASSLITHRELDPRRLRETIRHAHGLTWRWHTPYQPLVVLSEWDYVLESTREEPWRKGIAGYAQADLEPFRGIHFLLTLEAHDVGSDDSVGASLGSWLSYAWFFAPHADIRLDSIYQSVATPGGRAAALSWLIQGHLYL